MWAYPAVSFESIRVAAKDTYGADYLDIGIADKFVDPKSIYLTANDTTIYAFSNIDLGKAGPVVVDIPPDAIVGLIDDFTRSGFNGPFRGELGDATEGSVRTVGMVKWPGRIEPRTSNEMFSVHDWFPTLASLIGAKAPTDRPIDGVDQSAFITGKQPKSNRESLITFVGDEIASVRWRQFRLYPKQFVLSPGNPAMTGLAGSRLEGNGFPAIFNIEADPREEVNVVGTSGWVVAPYLQTIGA